MKYIQEQAMIQHYMSQYKLDQILSKPESLPFQLRVYACDEVVLKGGDTLDGLYFQVEGRTKVSSSVETGKSLLLRFCHPLAVFGDIEFIQKVVIQSQVEAVEQTSFLFINKHTVETELMQDHKFLNELLKHLSYKLQTCTTASRINLLASVDERFASYLLTTRNQQPFGKEILTPYFPEIASLIGTTPRHLNRVIQKLTDMKILKKEKKKLIVLDWELLDEISNGLRYE
ncbi:Crp/Fnr family transcriptional regulator [Paenibacillus terrigena]|uniref:Crp/Fnr family transcriptional regulator n=1 Tax=Paenibacillus terrigena TaxID=369333 RepID=UPI00036C2CB3|nr:Crp/Fnr family transcriptional regulator [Paenibacillus terrigena]